MFYPWCSKYHVRRCLGTQNPRQNHLQKKGAVSIRVLMGSTSWCVFWFFDTWHTSWRHDVLVAWLHRFPKVGPTDSAGLAFTGDPSWSQEVWINFQEAWVTWVDFCTDPWLQIVGWYYNVGCSLVNWLYNDTWSISTMRLWFLVETDGIFGAMLNMLVYQRIASFVVFLFGTWLIIWDGCTLEHGSVCNSWRPNCWPKTPQMKVRLLANPGWQIHRNR